MTDLNQLLFSRAQKTIPGGVNSPVRAFAAVGGTPRFIQSAQGPYLFDANGKRYIDYIGSWGPMILGHGHPEVVAAVQAALLQGFSFGAPTEGEITLAETLVRLVPSMQQVRLVSSGTEATMSAVRLARGATGRDLLVKFEGCYHGHSDALLVKAGSGLLTFGHPTSAGVSKSVAAQTVVLPFNDIAALEACFAQLGPQLAAVIIEPVAGNMNLLPASVEFLSTLRTLCTQSGTVLIFDEVMSGFRVALGGAQAVYGITPDLTTLGKVIGGGMPLAAFGGRADLMAHIAPLGGVYQAGTLSGNPVAVACGLATLRLIQAPDFYQRLSAQTTQLVTGLSELAQRAGIEFSAQAKGSMFGLYFCAMAPQNYTQVKAMNNEQFKKFFHAMLDEGVYLAPAAFEAGFVSIQHDATVIEATLAAAQKAFAQL